MRLRNLALLIQLYLALLFFFTVNCQNERAAEEKLLGVFQHKLSRLKSHQRDSYANYMQAENKSFPRDQKHVNELILEINAEYSRMPEKRRSSYEKKWRLKFQPVVNEIFRRTHSLVTRETRALTQETMSQIERLSIERKAMAKKLPEERLKPVFFILPSET